MPEPIRRLPVASKAQRSASIPLPVRAAWPGRAPLLALLCLLLLAISSCMGNDGESLIPTVPTSEVGDLQTPVVNEHGPAFPGRLLFTVRGQVWVREGEQDRPLIASGKAYHPSWSPDGQRLAYTQREESYADIYVKQPGEDGRGLQLTINEPAGIDARSIEHVRSIKWAFYPTWSPDGEQLAFVSQRFPPSCNGNGAQGDCSPPIEYPLALYIMSVDDAAQGLEARQVWVEPDTELTHPDWSPDGRFIAVAEFYRGTGVEGMSIGLFDVVNETYASISGIPDGSYDPAWSPDGKWLVFARRDGSKTDLWAVAAPGSAKDLVEPFQLTTLGTARAPEWSPDGDFLAYLSTSGGSVDLNIASVKLNANGRPALEESIALFKQQHIDTDSGIAWGQ